MQYNSVLARVVVFGDWNDLVVREKGCAQCIEIFGSNGTQRVLPLEKGIGYGRKKRYKDNRTSRRRNTILLA